MVPASLDQADTALQILDDWSYGDTTVADEGIARLLAATLHDGPGTALERFAATGELDAEAALSELGDVTVPLEREGWVDALGRYIITKGGRS
ncbi:hypothetical protein [Microbacterium sp.]|mgnify:FL=1|uniref:hypothetical protein n=1 Tax=unclassified Microbacterium TaxID=2609290 RepID=UPI000C532CBB|nr:hypothetical protein [Microbacterium sp.]MAY50702.1 hypothetical protein [Microbacterium sp.]HAS31167.1 hypothetical protein [Microbacterium sp.]HBR89663.1 hypothetical protein [Microbacterium sp.]HBS75937.1 hypothetical protein [Microbacterium sp.]